jgi:hypothetical protein
MEELRLRLQELRAQRSDLTCPPSTTPGQRLTWLSCRQRACGRRWRCCLWSPGQSCSPRWLRRARATEVRLSRTAGWASQAKGCMDISSAGAGPGHKRAAPQRHDRGSHRALAPWRLVDRRLSTGGRAFEGTIGAGGVAGGQRRGWALASFLF